MFGGKEAQILQKELDLTKSKSQNTASTYHEIGAISCSNTCKISTSGSPCGYCGDGVFQSVDASNNPLEECENTAEGIKYLLGETKKTFDGKSFTDNEDAYEESYEIPISGIYEITAKGARGGAGGSGGKAKGVELICNGKSGGSGGDYAKGGTVTVQYYFTKGTELKLYAGQIGGGGGSGNKNSSTGGTAGSAGESYNSSNNSGYSGGAGTAGNGQAGSNGGSGGGGGGGGGASVVKKSDGTLLVLAHGGGGGGGGEGGGPCSSGGSGFAATNCSGGADSSGHSNNSNGGRGREGGNGGRYSDSECNYYKPGYHINLTPSSTEGNNDGAGSISITLKKYAPCKSNCKFETGTISSDLKLADTKTVNCTGLPANAQWNTTSTVDLTWNGSSWSGSTTGVYNTSASTTECRFKCKPTYFWENGKCVKTKVVPCPVATTPTMTPYSDDPSSTWEWNVVSEIEQSYNGSEWTPSDTVYSPAERPDPTSSECRFRCIAGFTYQKDSYTYTNGNGSTGTVQGNTCINVRTINCNQTTLPEHATWWGESDKHGTPAEHTITQHWTQANGWQNTTTGSYSASAIAGECRFHCNKGYTWSDSANECVANKRTTVNCNTKPGNTDWNDGGKNGKFEQTWSDTGLGSETCNATQWANNDCWFPRSKTATYQPTTAAECGYKCSADYHTENSGSTCISDYMTPSGTNPDGSTSECQPGNPGRCKCENLPTGGIANTATAIARHWENHGGTWQWWPRNSYTNNYSETASTTECKYKCWSDATHHFEWNGSACVGSSAENQSCTGLPEHATWWGETEKRVNPADHKITQTWTQVSGEWKWMPVIEGSYSVSNPNKPNECWFHCNNHYTWDSSSKKCVADPRTTVNCGYGKPGHSTWNDGGKNGKFTQTWSDTGIGSETCSDAQWSANDCWFPRSKNSNHSATAGECIYKCNTNYTWNNSQSSSACIANTNTYTCSGKPDGTEWNMGSASSSHSYEQTWDEDHAGCNPSVTDPTNTSSCWYPQATSATYNETANANECHYKCDSTHTRYNNACVNSRSISCDSLTVANTVWSSNNSTSKTITQTWTSANGWQPSLTGTHNTATDENKCYYKCESEGAQGNSSAHFYWNNGTCVANTRSATCGTLKDNALWWSTNNTGGLTITQTWNASQQKWLPETTPSYSSSSNTSGCYFKCYSSNRTYSWNSNENRCNYCNDGEVSDGETCDKKISYGTCYVSNGTGTCEQDCSSKTEYKYKSYTQTCNDTCGAWTKTGTGTEVTSCNAQKTPICK